MIEGDAFEQLYSGTDGFGGEVDKLTYFAISVFWRAAARDWRFLDHTKQLDIGARTECLRRYLLDEIPFPGDMTLNVFVSLSPAPMGYLHAPCTRQKLPFEQYTFSVPGVFFALNTGAEPGVAGHCAIHSARRVIYISERGETVNALDAGHILALHRAV